MPREDRTGPTGQGPMTGWGAGYCAGHAVPGFMNPQPATGAGRGRGGGGRGGGRGGWRHRHRFYATGLPGWQRFGMGEPTGATASSPSFSGQEELATLKQHAADLEHALAELKTRIGGLEKSAANATSPLPEDQR